MLKRWSVKLTHASPKERDVHTHTWADTYELACERMGDSMSEFPEIWEGWACTLTEDVEYNENYVSHPRVWPSYIDNP